MAEAASLGPVWFAFAIKQLFGTTSLAQIANVAAPAALTAATLTENSGAIGGTNDGNLPALVDPSGDSGASVIAGIRENAAMINKLHADITALRTTVANEIAALKTSGLQASS